MQIEHERRQRPLQPRQHALEHHEPRAGQLRRRLEVHQPERLADLEVLLGLVDAGKLRRLPDAAHLPVARLVGADRHILRRQVGDHRQRIVQRSCRPRAPPSRRTPARPSAPPPRPSARPPWPRPWRPSPCRSPWTPRCAAPAPPAARVITLRPPSSSAISSAENFTSPPGLMPALAQPRIERLRVVAYPLDVEHVACLLLDVTPPRSECQSPALARHGRARARGADEGTCVARSPAAPHGSAE